MIDSHVHVFLQVSERYPRDVAPVFPADRAAPVEELLALMDRHGVASAVLVALSHHDAYVAECLRDYPETFRAILVQDPVHPDPTEIMRRRIETAGAHGVRVFDLGPRHSTFELLEWLAAEDLKLWAYLQPSDFPRLVAILEALPDLAVVLNHLAFPSGELDTDAAGRPVGRVAIPPPTWPVVSELSRFRNVHVMFSGQYAFSEGAYPYPDLIEYARMVYETFGAARMMWASDYPWPVLDPGYGRLLELVDRFFPNLSGAERADILGGSCARLFGF